MSKTGKIPSAGFRRVCHGCEAWQAALPRPDTTPRSRGSAAKSSGPRARTSWICWTTWTDFTPRERGDEMLVLSRKVGESILIGDSIVVTITELAHPRWKIGGAAPHA